MGTSWPRFCRPPPGKSGVDFLVGKAWAVTSVSGATRTVLVTGQADQSDTICAVNQAGLDYYIAPGPEELRAPRDQLTGTSPEAGVDPCPT